MKGGFYGLRAKQISLILITIVCTTILIWAWEKTPLLASLLPPQGRLLHLSPEILMSAPIVSRSNISSAVEKDVLNVPEEHDAVISHGIEKKKTNVMAAPFRKEGDDDIPEKEIAKEQERKHTDAAAGRVPEQGVHVEEREAPTRIIKQADDKQLSGKNNSSKLAEPESVALRNSSKRDSPKREEDKENLTTPVSTEACNYAKGKWVVDDSRPLYSGFDCKQWLSGMWACRLTQRTDFAYEKLRWQPKNCVMEEFTGSKFLERMQHKTIAFVGDSLGRQQFQSLMCMVTGGKEMPHVLDVGREYGLVKAKGSIRPDGWVYRFPSTNTTILYYWSASLSDLEPLDTTNPITEYAMHLDRPPAFLRRFLHKFDVLVLNTGHHWNRGKFRANRWVMHVGGTPNIDRKIAEIGGAKNLTIYSIVSWVDKQLPKYPGLKAFLRTLSPRHFFNGDWNTGGTCDNKTPSEGKEVLQDESSDPVAAGAVKGTKVKLLDITALSQLRDEGHISRYSIKATPGMQDCLHWCLPGVPDSWNEILFAQL